MKTPPESEVVKIVPEFSLEDISTTQNSFVNENRDELNKNLHLKLSRKPDFEDNAMRTLWQRHIDENVVE